MIVESLQRIPSLEQYTQHMSKGRGEGGRTIYTALTKRNVVRLTVLTNYLQLCPARSAPTPYVPGLNLFHSTKEKLEPVGYGAF